MQTTRAKFKCTEIAKREGYPKGVTYAAKMQAVTSGSPENESFFAATPWGTLELSTVREDHFEVGKSYYVDFSPAEP